jgi:hypothetical protein
MQFPQEADRHRPMIASQPYIDGGRDERRSACIAVRAAVRTLCAKLK